jgi:hypothetical protein
MNSESQNRIPNLSISSSKHSRKERVKLGGGLDLVALEGVE